MIEAPLCVDGRALGEGGTGVATYARSVIAAMRLIGRDRLLLREHAAPVSRLARLGVTLRLGATLFERRPDAELGFSSLGGRGIFRGSQDAFTLRRRFAALSVNRGPGLMHWTYPMPMRVRGWQNIYTVHDVIPLDYPELSPVNGERLRRILDGIVRHGNRIVTVSEYSRSRIIGHLGCDPDFVVNCGQPVIFNIDHDGAHLPDGLEANGFFLFCGRIERRKNIERIVAGHCQSGTKLPLVLVGPRGMPDAGIVRILGTGGRVRHLEYLPRPQVEALVRNARAIVFPSLAEGFGLPVAEAMSAGTPVLTSGEGALAEIAGDAALLVDPYSVDQIAAGIAAFSNSIEFCRSLSVRGLARARRFELMEFALRLHHVYGRALANA